MLERPVTRPDPLTWQTLLGLVDRERLTGHLMTSIASRALPVSAEQHQQADAAHSRARDEAAVLERLLVEAGDALDDAGIAYRVLDAPYQGRVALLVDAGQLGAAFPALQRRGLRRLGRRGTVVADAEGRQIALHTRLPVVRGHGPVGTLAWSAQPMPLPVQGRSLPALPKEAALLHRAWQAAPGRLAALRELTELSLTVNGDLGRAVAFAQHVGGQKILADGVRRAWEEFRIADIVPLSVWARRQEGGRRRTVLVRT